MDVNLTSTRMSTNYQETLSKAREELKLASKAGARSETIKIIENRVQKLEDKATNEAKYRDIRFLLDWPDETLITNYEKVTEEAKKYLDNAKTPTLLDTPEDKENFKRYQNILRLIEKLEDEGRKRNLAYFLSEEELKAIFSQDSEKDDPVPLTVANQEGEKS